jgi:hypothetical protein
VQRINIYLETQDQGRLDLTERTAAYRFSTINPGGYNECEITLNAPERDVWTLIESAVWAQGVLTMWAGTGEIAWQGTVGAQELGGNALTLRAYGQWHDLQKTEIWRAYADSTYTRWLAQDSDAFALDTSNRLRIATRDGTDYTSGDEAVIRWPQSYELGTIVHIEATVTLSVTSGQWVCGFRDGAGNDIWSQRMSISGTGSVPISEVVRREPDGFVVIRTEPRPRQVGVSTSFVLTVDDEIVATSSTSVAGIDEDAEVEKRDGSDVIIGATSETDTNTGGISEAIQITTQGYRKNGDVAAVRGIQLQPERTIRVGMPGEFDVSGAPTSIEFFLAALYPGGVAYAEATDVIIRTVEPTNSEDVVTLALAQAGIARHDVQSTGIEVNDAVFDGTSTGQDVIRAMALRGDGTNSWLAVIYEDGGIFRAWAEDYEPDWLIVREDARELPISKDVLSVRNAVRGLLPDGTLTAWQEDADSIARYGRRELTLNLDQTTTTEAERLVRVYLNERKEPLVSLEIGAETRIRKPDGSLWPAYLVRAGDVVVLRDFYPHRDEVIRVAETEYDGETLRVLPQGVESRLEVILANRNR